jgi:hypothetical protein
VPPIPTTTLSTPYGVLTNPPPRTVSTVYSPVDVNCQCQLCNQHRYLRELGIKDVEFVNIDYHDKKEHKAPEHLKVIYDDISFSH